MPWFLGEPYGDHDPIPAKSLVTTVAEHRRAWSRAHEDGQKVLEIAELLALEQRGALRPEETKRLVELPSPDALSPPKPACGGMSTCCIGGKRPCRCSTRLISRR